MVIDNATPIAQGHLPHNSRVTALKEPIVDTHSGIALYDHQAGIIEYIRFSRMTIMLDTGTLRVNDGVLAPAPVDFPDILYIRFNGRQHYDRVAAIQLLSIVSLAGVVFFFGLVYSICRANRRYRVRLEQQERLVSLGEAARTLTHEIKNPLSAMTIQLALLRKTLPLENHADLEVVDNEIKRLNHLTNKVSDFLRNPVGEPQVIELRSFIENLSKLFAEPIMLSASGDERFEVQFDPERARSVFENLLKNAVESSAQGTPHVEVFLTKEKKRFIRIEIMDRGDGIPEKNLKSVFDPFFTTKIHGSGIGLSISRQFISAEGGSIRLLSREGGGTCVEVILPAYRHVRPHSRKENKDTL